MKRIYVYGLTDERDEEFVEWFADEFYVHVENWVYLEEETCYLDMNRTGHHWNDNLCKDMAKRIKEKFPETKVEIFEFVMNNTPIIRV